MKNILKKFQGESVDYIETVAVKDGISCDIYTYTNTSHKDLAIITVDAGFYTPLQKVLNGNKTIEGIFKGRGYLLL